MLHNETLNIWTHLFGTVCFVILLFYFINEIKPTSLHESKDLLSRWTTDFDVGRFEDLYCDRDDFQFPNPNQCPYEINEVLGDLLETEKLLDWHKLAYAREEPQVAQSNLNYHSKAFEKVDHYLRNVLVVLSDPRAFFQKCLVCANDAISSLPAYINKTL